MQNLHQFLSSDRESILALAKRMTIVTAASRGSSAKLDEGLEIAYDQLTAILRRQAGEEADAVTATIDTDAAARHGKEYLRLGYSVSQVVHGYGAICQAVTESAVQMRIEIGAEEFRELNLCLDIAIADAVTEYEKLKTAETAKSEVQRISFLTHELRNSLQSASLALQMIQEGTVGFDGSTAHVLNRSLLRMHQLIDSAIAEIRTGVDHPLDLHHVSVNHLLAEVDITFSRLAAERGVKLIIDADPQLEVVADRLLLVSALQNIVQNAVKFTRPNTTIVINARKVDGKVVVQVKDECGGLDDGKIEELFRPFVQKSEDRTGLGLGLAIGRKAMVLNRGTLSATNQPPVGCTFTIELQVAAVPTLELEKS